MPSRSVWSITVKGTFLLVVPFLLLPEFASASALGELRRDMVRYRQHVTSLLQRPGGQDASPITDYLEFVLKEAEYIEAFARDVPPPAEELHRRIEAFATGRAERRERWLDKNDLLPHGESVAEADAWASLVLPYLGEDFLRRLVVQRALFKRRKYDEDFRESANFIERHLNRTIGFLDYRKEQVWYRQEGISRFESHTGFEPLVLLETENTIGAMATAGVLYNFFPTMEQSADNRYLATAHSGSWLGKQLVEHVKSVGVQIGAGALFDGPSAVYGLGLRVRAITLWGVYSPGESKYSIALGFNDFEWLKKLNFVAPF